MIYEIPLGKCGSFLTTMLGDFCDRFEIATRLKCKKYKFDKDHFDGEKSGISELSKRFTNELYLFNAFSRFSELMLHFPSFLQESIRHYQPHANIYFTEQDFPSEQKLIRSLLVEYVAYYYNGISNYGERKEFKNLLSLHITNTYDDILKNKKEYIESLPESCMRSTENWPYPAKNCPWSILKGILEKMMKATNVHGTDTDEEIQFYGCAKILIQHYLYLGFKKALKEIFNFSDEEIVQVETDLSENIDPIANDLYYDFRNRSRSFNVPVNSEEIIYTFLYILMD